MTPDIPAMTEDKLDTIIALLQEIREALRPVVVPATTYDPNYWTCWKCGARVPQGCTHTCPTSVTAR